MTTTTPSIVIPADLLPADGRFGSGPSRGRQSTLDALAASGTGSGVSRFANLEIAGTDVAVTSLATVLGDASVTSAAAVSGGLSLQIESVCRERVYESNIIMCFYSCNNPDFGDVTCRSI